MWKTNYHTESGYIEKSDLAPCPKCGSTDLDVLANVVECLDCEYSGPDHGIHPDGNRLPEYMCDWRTAICQWNDACNKRLR